MRLRLPLALTLLVVAALLVPGVMASPRYPEPSAVAQQSSLAQRWIVQLREPPLAQAPGISPVYSILSVSPAGQHKLQLNTPAAQSYRTLLQQQQQRVFLSVQQAFPSATLHQTYQVVFNGLSVAIPGVDEATVRARLRSLPGVAQVYQDQPRELTMYSSLPMINAEQAWNYRAIGGQQNAGRGIKIAVIDTGIKVDHPFFNPEGYSYPSGYPKGDTAHTTPKVIVARAYFRPDQPPLPGSETPEPGPEDSSHGTHVAGTAAGVANTTATAYDVTRTISGVAPRAYLMSYKAFYANESIFSQMAFETELIAALEDAVEDDADVISNSWGGRDNVDAHFDPVSVAANAASDAGVVVVFSAGNSGPSKSTADSRDYTNKLIMVGATTTNQTMAAGFVDVTAPEGVPDTLRDSPYTGADFGEFISDGAVGPAPYLPVHHVSGSSLACDPLPEGSLNGQIVLIERGICHFSLKVYYAQQAGAVAAIVYNSAEGGEELISMGGGDRSDEVTIPSVFVKHSMGAGMIDWYGQHGAAAQAKIDAQARVIDMPPDVLAPFSSRGPSFQSNLKPDVVAPGVNILSAGFAQGDGMEQHLGYGLASGTSMAAPHVAGSAALLRQAHPDWTPLDVKSALMATANLDVWLDTEHTSPAGVLERGSGRIDVGRAVDPGMLFNPPSLSFSNLATTPGQSTTASTQVLARNVSGARQTYTLSARQTDGQPFAITTSPSSLSIGAGGSAIFNVSIEIPPDAAPGDYGGVVELSGGPQTVHVPVWARTLPSTPAEKVLLIDNDGSSSLEAPNYADYYYNALSELGISVRYLDVDALAGQEQTLPDLGELQKHEIIIWFTGDNFYHDGDLEVSIPLTEADQNLLIAYLQGGGSLIATGQDLAETSDIEISPPDPRYGRSDLYHAYLGARFVQDNVFDTYGESGSTVVGMTAQPWLATIVLNLNNPDEATGTGSYSSAGNQTTVDEITVMDMDPRSLDKYAVPILKAASTTSEVEGIVGMQRYAEPTLEEPAIAFAYRSTYLSFGLEGVRSDTGTTTMKELLQSLLYWHVDRPSISIANPVAVPDMGQTVAMTATAQTNTPAVFVRYRWDFGDGTPFVETTESTVMHQYEKAGTYTVRVEGTDSWGHRALSSTPVTLQQAAGAAGAIRPSAMIDSVSSLLTQVSREVMVECAGRGLSSSLSSVPPASH